GRRRLARPRRPPAVDRARPRERRPRPRLALRTPRRRRRLAPCAARDQPRRLPLRPHRPARAGPRPHRRAEDVARRRAARDRAGVGLLLYRNGRGLALRGLADIADVMAGSSLPQVADGYSGVWRWLHDKAGPLAIGFVVCATLFSLTTQAWALGSAASDLSSR